MGLREILIRGCPIEDSVYDCLANELGWKWVGAVSLELVVVGIGGLWWWVDYGGGGGVVLLLR